MEEMYDQQMVIREKILSPRQTQVVTEVAKAKSNKEISALLKIAEKTVKMHLTTVYKILKVKNRCQLIHMILSEKHHYQKMNRFKARYAKYNQFTKASWGWYLQDGYLYVINEQMLTLVNVTGLWSDPSELEDFVNCDDEECWTLDSPYPASLNMAKQITDIVLQTRVYPFMSLMQDTKNDGKDETLLSGKPSK